MVDNKFSQKIEYLTKEFQTSTSDSFNQNQSQFLTLR